jgi:O-antigen/teichoic acid export membrane protein
MSYSKKVLSASIMFSAMKYISFVIGIFGQIYLARLIAPEYFVPFVLSFALLEIIYSFGEIGLNNAILNNQDKKNIFGTAFFMVIALSIILYAFVFMALLIFEYSKLFDIILLLALAKSIGMISVIYSTYLEKDFKHIYIGVSIVFSKIISIVLAIYLVYQGLNTYALVYKELIYFIVYFLLLFVLIHRKITYSFCILTLKSMITFSFKFFLVRIIGITTKNIPILFLGNVSDIGSALYEKSYYLGGLSNTLLSPINAKVSYAFYTKVKRDMQRISKGVYLNLYFTFRLILPFVVLIYLYSQEIVLFIYGENWIGVSPYLKGFSIFILFAPLYAIPQFLLLSQDKIELVIRNKLYSLILLIIFILYIYYSNTSYKYISWCVSILMFISFLHLMFYVQVMLNLNLNVLFVKPIISSAISSMIFYLDLHILLVSLLYVIIYIILIYMIEKKELKKIIKIFKKEESVASK